MGSPIDNTVQLVHFSKMMTMMTMMMMVLMTAIRTMTGIMVALKKKTRNIQAQKYSTAIAHPCSVGTRCVVAAERDAF